MDTKNYLIYDNQKYFSRFMKYEFRKSLNFEFFNNLKNFENRINKNSIVLFVIYSEDELANLVEIYKTGIPLIACTFNEKLLLTLRNMDNLLLLDTSKVKSEIIIELKSHLNLIDFIFFK